MSKKINFSDPGQWSDSAGRRPHQNADDRLPVKNMKDWGCTDDRIKAPAYSDRAYDLCCPVGREEYSKIVGQIQNVRSPSMLAKQRLHKDAFQTGDRIASTPSQDRAPLKGPQEAPQTPFAVGRKKKR